MIILEFGCILDFNVVDVVSFLVLIYEEQWWKGVNFLYIGFVQNFMKGCD